MHRVVSNGKVKCRAAAAADTVTVNPSAASEASSLPGGAIVSGGREGWGSESWAVVVQGKRAWGHGGGARRKRSAHVLWVSREGTWTLAPRLPCDRKSESGHVTPPPKKNHAGTLPRFLASIVVCFCLSLPPLSMNRYVAALRQACMDTLDQSHETHVGGWDTVESVVRTVFACQEDCR